MIPPRQQWCIQIDVTNHCPRQCSNCTRMLAHVPKQDRFFMPLDQFRGAIDALEYFPQESEVHPNRQNNGVKVVGIIGGEPLLHPDFEAICEAMRQAFPRKRNRGLWTSLPWQTHKYAAAVRNTFDDGGYINQNLHDTEVVHHPFLIAVEDLVSDAATMWKLIDACPLQHIWSSSITPKGFFFCEVAAAMDMVFQGPGGMPVTSACWQHDLAEYRDQIERWCPRCGFAAQNLPKRRDTDETDDLSESNLKRLRQVGSPRVAIGAYEVYAEEYRKDAGGAHPLNYMRKPGR